MSGLFFQPYTVKLGHRTHVCTRASSSDSRIALRCRATAGCPSNDQSSSSPKIIDRRQVLFALAASSALLIPSVPSIADETETRPLPSPSIEVEALAQTIQEPRDEDAIALLDSQAPAQLGPEPTSVPQTSTSGKESAVVAQGPTQVFMDLKINGEPAGRIIIELFDDVPAGTARFADLVAGRQGVDYRLSKFNGVLPTYIRNDGLSRLSYSATEVSPIAFGDSLDALETELDQQTRRHDQAGLVSLIVREREERPVKERLVARDGKFITVLEQAGEAPNGTQFTITTAASAELDRTNLIIGRLVEGDALLKRISALPVNKPRNDNPYFQAGKAMGDKRAVTAERAFYRPFQKVVVVNSGILS